jgi:hypothetical protein
VAVSIATGHGTQVAYSVVEPKSVNVLILDDQLELADPIRQLARLHGWRPRLVGSLQELELALHAHGPAALVLINQQPPLTSWELEQRLPGLKAASPIVVLSAVVAIFEVSYTERLASLSTSSAWSLASTSGLQASADTYRLLASWTPHSHPRGQ